MKLFDLHEMALPSRDHINKIYYHGTQSEDNIKNIIKNGLNPRDIKIKSKSTYNLTPVAGKVYITPNISYAQIYALGGDLAGTSYKSKTSFGYVFSILGKELKDIQPDEDSIGEMIYKYILEKNKNNEFLSRMSKLARTKLTANQFEKLKDGDYITFAQTGKKLLNLISDEDKLKFIDLGAHVAHTGNLKIETAWKIDLSLISKLKSDGSNFFDLAKKIHPK